MGGFGEGVFASIGKGRPYQQCIVHVEFQTQHHISSAVELMRKACDIYDGPYNNALAMSFTLRLANAFCYTVRLIARQTEGKLAHFAKIGIGKVDMLGLGCPTRDSIACIVCRRGSFASIRSYAECKSGLNTSFIDHITDANFVCIVPHYRETIYRRFLPNELQKRLQVLEKFINRF